MTISYFILHVKEASDKRIKSWLHGHELENLVT